MILEPERKAGRWILLPTLVLGAGAAMGGGISFLRLLTGGSGMPWPVALLAMCFGGLMAGTGLWGLAYRGRFGVHSAEGTILVERRSVFGVSRETFQLADFDGISLRRVRARSSAHQPDLVGSCQMIWLDAEREVHLVSCREGEAVDVASRLSEATGLSVHRRENG